MPHFNQVQLLLSSKTLMIGSLSLIVLRYPRFVLKKINVLFENLLLTLAIVTASSQ